MDYTAMDMRNTTNANDVHHINTNHYNSTQMPLRNKNLEIDDPSYMFDNTGNIYRTSSYNYNNPVMYVANNDDQINGMDMNNDALRIKRYSSVPNASLFFPTNSASYDYNNNHPDQLDYYDYNQPASNNHEGYYPIQNNFENYPKDPKDIEYNYNYDFDKQDQNKKKPKPELKDFQSILNFSNKPVKKTGANKPDLQAIQQNINEAYVSNFPNQLELNSPLGFNIQNTGDAKNHQIFDSNNAYQQNEPFSIHNSFNNEQFDSHKSANHLYNNVKAPVYNNQEIINKGNNENTNSSIENSRILENSNCTVDIENEQNVNEQAPPTDVKDPASKPRQQPVRYAGDMYTPQWVRYQGHKKEGYCNLCMPPKWLQLKNSAFWYHKQFYHGISSVSGTFFNKPIATRYTDVQKNTLEGLCHQCNCWVPVSSSKKHNSVLWFRHAHKCHIYHKPKNIYSKPK